jgi:hypothetical protein
VPIAKRRAIQPHDIVVSVRGRRAINPADVVATFAPTRIKTPMKSTHKFPATLQ